MKTKKTKKYAVGGYQPVGLPVSSADIRADKRQTQKDAGFWKDFGKFVSERVLPMAGPIGAGIGAVASMGLSKQGFEPARYTADMPNNYAVDTTPQLPAQELQLNTGQNNGLGFKSGGSIHINPANKGKFNATKKRTGKTTEELTHSKNPVTRKRAIFAQNAAKWHHETGGDMEMGYYQNGGPITPIVQDSIPAFKYMPTVTNPSQVNSTATPIFTGLPEIKPVMPDLMGDAIREAASYGGFRGSSLKVKSKDRYREHATGGDIQLNSGAFQVQGNAQTTDGNKYNMGNENVALDHNEVVRDNFVFSDILTNPLTGNKFSKDAKVIEKKIGKSEKKIQAYNDLISTKTLNHLKGMSKDLEKVHEAVATSKGMRNTDGSTKQHFATGGTVDGPGPGYIQMEDNNWYNPTTKSILTELDGKYVQVVEAADYLVPEYEQMLKSTNQFSGFRQADTGTPAATPVQNTFTPKGNTGPNYELVKEGRKPGLGLYRDRSTGLFYRRDSRGRYTKANSEDQTGWSQLYPLNKPTTQVAPADFGTGTSPANTLGPQSRPGPTYSDTSFNLNPVDPRQRMGELGAYLKRPQQAPTGAIDQILNDRLYGDPYATPDSTLSENAPIGTGTAPTAPILGTTPGTSTPKKVATPAKVRPTIVPPSVGGFYNPAPAEGNRTMPDGSVVPDYLLPNNTTPYNPQQTPEQRAAATEHMPFIWDTQKDAYNKPWKTDEGRQAGLTAGDATTTSPPNADQYRTPFTTGDALQGIGAFSKFAQALSGVEQEPIRANTAPINKEVYDPRAPLYQNQRNFSNALNSIQAGSLNTRRAVASQLFANKLNSDSSILDRYSQMNLGARTQYEQRLADRQRENIGYANYASDLNARNRAARTNNLDVAFDTLSNFGASLNQKKQAADMINIYRKLFPSIEKNILSALG